MAAKDQTVKGLEGSEPIVDDGPVESTPDHPSEGSLKKDDQIAGTVFGDAESNDPPVRTDRPDVPIIQRLAVGAGQHVPTAHLSDDLDSASGRFVQSETPETAKESTRK